MIKNLLLLILCLWGMYFFIGCSLISDVSPMATGTKTGDFEYSKSDASIGEDHNGNNTTQISPGQLTAGQWRDLDHWDFWLGLFGNQSSWDEYETTWDLYTRMRFRIRVSDGAAPAEDVPVYLLSLSGDTVWYARTNNKGTAEMFIPDVQENVDTFVVVSCNTSVTCTQHNAPDIIEIRTDILQPKSNNVDIMFVVDATGSMSDELEYLKTEVAHVIQRVYDKQSNLSIRTSVNFYRDQGDAYVVRPFPFTSSLSKVTSQIRAQRACGGGDYPEAVHAALENALHQHEWSSSVKARLLFCVLDAPPHETQHIIADMKRHIQTAAKMGIRIIPIASSGVDKTTEFILRVMSILSDGTYVFLTDHSGIGNTHLDPTIGQYEVRLLNDLLVEIIGEYVQ